MGKLIEWIMDAREKARCDSPSLDVLQASLLRIRVGDDTTEAQRTMDLMKATTLHVFSKRGDIVTYNAKLESVLADIEDVRNAHQAWDEDEVLSNQESKDAFLAQLDTGLLDAMFDDGYLTSTLEAPSHIRIISTEKLHMICPVRINSRLLIPEIHLRMLRLGYRTEPNDE